MRRVWWSVCSLYLYKIQIRQTRFRRTHDLCRSWGDPLLRSVGFVFILFFSYYFSLLSERSSLLVLPPLMVVCFLALFKAEYLYLHITHIHTHTLGRRTIIYRTTSSVRRIRHPCASLQHCRIENIITTRSPLIIIVVVVVRFSRIFSHFN